MNKPDKFDLHQRKAVLKIRAKAIDAARLWFNQQKFTEVQGPILLPAVGDRPNSFKVNYFDKTAYLAGGLQPYSDIFLEMFEKVFTVSPTFRADRLKSKRHLSEYWRIEANALKYDLTKIIQTQEELLTHICHVLCNEVSEELTLLGSNERFAQITVPFTKLTYDKAIDCLQQVGCNVYWGQSLDWKMEQTLSLMFNKPFFVSEFPINGETFIYKTHPKRPELSLCADLFAPEGYGELASAAELITNKRAMQKKINELTIDPKDVRWYINLKRFGSFTQSGFAMGIERLLQWICKLSNIADAHAFPRSYQDNYP